MADIKNIDVVQTISSVNFTVQPNTNVININKIVSGSTGGSQNLQQVTDIGNSTTNSITANSFIKNGGTSAQFLLADGSVSTGVVTTVSAISPITSTGGTTPSISTSMSTNKLIGRYTTGTGVMQEVTVGTGLNLTSGGILNNTATPTPLGYYGAFQDNTIQTAAAINTPYAMKLGITDISNQVSVVSDGVNLTRITITNTGIYNIQFSAQFDRTNSGTDSIDIWLRKNGTDIPGSGGRIVITGSAVQSPIIAAWNYVLDVTEGDYYQLMWATPDTHVRLLTEVAQTTPFAHPIIPSVILTVTQQSGIMAGTGVTAINSLTGSTQTLTTGTTGTDFAIVDSGSDHKFNLPDASATARGVITTDTQTIAGSKTFSNQTVIGSGVLGNVTFGSLPTAIIGDPTGGVLDIRNSNTNVNTGNTVGNIQFTSTDDSGTGGYVNSSIKTVVTSNPGAGSAGTSEIIFSTNSGSIGTSPTEKIRIKNTGLQIANETSSTIASFDADKVVKSLSTATYPSLTELALLKGVNGSSVQTQLDSKQPTLNFVPGLHALIPVVTGVSKSYSLAVNGTNLATIAGTANTLKALLFLPARTITSVSLQINITVGVATALARILIYSDLNGLPNTKLYESADLDCSTLGLKTATTAFTFVAGTSYWICVHNGALLPTYNAYTAASLPSLFFSATPQNMSSYLLAVALGSAPTTFGTPTNSSSTTPYVSIVV